MIYLFVVLPVPKLETFEAWSNRMKKYLQGLHVWDIVEAATEPPTPDDEIAFKAWSKKNALALYLIWESSEVYSLIGNCTTAKTAWDLLAELIKPERGSYLSNISGKCTCLKLCKKITYFLRKKKKKNT